MNKEKVRALCTLCITMRLTILSLNEIQRQWWHCTHRNPIAQKTWVSYGCILFSSAYKNVSWASSKDLLLNWRPLHESNCSSRRSHNVRQNGFSWSTDETSCLISIWAGSKNNNNALVCANGNDAHAYLHVDHLRPVEMHCNAWGTQNCPLVRSLKMQC